jgi:hypothetical protein
MTRLCFECTGTVPPVETVPQIVYCLVVGMSESDRRAAVDLDQSAGTMKRYLAVVIPTKVTAAKDEEAMPERARVILGVPAICRRMAIFWGGIRTGARGAATELHGIAISESAYMPNQIRPMRFVIPSVRIASHE